MFSAFMALEVFSSGGAAMRYDGSWNIGSMLNRKPPFAGNP